MNVTIDQLSKGLQLGPGTWYRWEINGDTIEELVPKRWLKEEPHFVS